MPKSHEMEELSSSKSLRLGEELFEDGERSPFYDSDSLSDTLSVNGSASASTSARSSRSSTLGSGFSTRSATTSESDSETEALDNIRVVARVRPLNLSEKERGDNNIIKLPASSNGAVWIDNSFGQIKPFTFNAAFGEETSQQEMFEQCGIKHLVEMAVEGYSCTAFAYGQTGSGKTYTITGPLEHSADKETFIPDPDIQGLIERCFHYLFELKENHSDVELTLKASYLEVYNEKVQDLLNPSSARDSLPVRWARDRGFYVENLFFLECDTVDDLTAVLEEGLGNRQVGSHLMNDHSSRSHSMLTVYIDTESSDPADDSGYPIVKHGKLSLVDLAGSERVKETKSVGGTFTESQNINKSLLTLGNCISALSDPRKKGGHIPYRDSKLTKLLADSLGGDGITLMIACISPSSYVVQDTLNTLRYAHRAKRIKNKPVVHMDPKEKLILSLKREIKLLRTENAYFRQQLGLPNSESQTSLSSNDSKTTTTRTENGSTPKLNPPTPQPAGQLQNPEDSQRLTTASMALGANSGLYDMLQEYMVENEHLRSTNVELVQSREEVTRQQMVLSRENDRLSKKLEELERVIVSSPMTLRTLSGVESLRGVERTTSLPEEQFMSSFPGSNGGARPSHLAAEGNHLERRNSLPMQSKDRRRSVSDPEPPRVVTKFPPIQNGPYPNFVGQGGWSQIPEAQTPPQEVTPKPNNNVAHRALPHSVTDPSNKPKATLSTKKRSQPVPVNERQKPANSYARMFAAQKQKKAKEAKEPEGKNLQNGDASQGVGATEHLNFQVHHQGHMDASGYSGHPSVGWPVDNGIHPSYDPTLAGNLQLAERTRQELQELDSQIEYHKFMAHNRYKSHPPR